MLVFAPAYRYPDWQYRFREGSNLSTYRDTPRYANRPWCHSKVVHIRTRLHDIFMRIMLIDSPGVAKYTRSSIFAIYISRPTGKPSFALYSFIRTAFVKSLSKSTRVTWSVLYTQITLSLSCSKDGKNRSHPQSCQPPAILHSFPNQINTVIYPTYIRSVRPATSWQHQTPVMSVTRLRKSH